MKQLLLAFGILCLVAFPAFAAEYEGIEAHLLSQMPLGSTARQGLRPPRVEATQIAYSNLTPAGAVQAQGPAALVGANTFTRLLADDITPLPQFAGADVSRITFSVANTNATGVRARIRMRLYAADGASGGPGTLIAGFTFSPITFAGQTTSAFFFDPPGFTMPGTKFWAGITYDDSDGATGATATEMGGLGQALADPVSVGSSANLQFLTNDAGSFFANNPVGTLSSIPVLFSASYLWEFQVDVPDVKLIAMNDVLQRNGADQLLRIPDLSTGVAQLVGPLGASFLDCEALAVLRDPPGLDRIFTVDNDRLVELDPLTGNGTVIGPVGFTDVDGIEFQPGTNTLYGVTFGSNKIIKIDLNTGHGTAVVNHVFEGHRLNDIAFHPDGRAFIITDDVPVHIYQVDVTNGAKLNTYTILGATSCASLLWSEDGTKLYSAGDRGNFQDLVTIDLVTGTATFVSASPSGFHDIEGLAWLNTPQFNTLFSASHPSGVTSSSPLALRLYPNVPNPFNPTTRLEFDLPEAGAVDLSVYDVAGRTVANLLHAHLEAGHHQVVWSGRSQSGQPVAAGIYYCTLRGPDGARTRTMSLVK